MKTNLFDVFRNAMLSSPHASRKEAFSSFLETVKSDPAYLDVLADNYFHSMAGRWKVDQVGKSRSLISTRTSADRADSAARASEAHTDLKARVRAVILLDLTLPDGKRLRDATGAECVKAGGFYTEVARHIKPTQVVDKHLSEADLRSIASRFESSKRAAA